MQFDWLMKRPHNGHYITHPPSERRMRDREELYNLLCRSPGISSKDKIDLIISMFRAQYEGSEFGGLHKHERRRLYEQEKGICYWCRKHVNFSEMTIEHKTPRADGGEDVWDNFSIAHGLCNHSRPDPMLVRMGLPHGKRDVGIDYELVQKMYHQDIDAPTQ